MGLDALWHLRGSAALNPATSDESVLDRIEAMLDRQWKPITERGTDFVAFSDPLWGKFAPNWLAMTTYDQGVFWITQDLGGRYLRYRLRSLHGFIFCLCVAIMFFVVGYMAGGPGKGLLFAGLAFGWLYGINLLLAAVRVPELIERTVTP